MTKGYRDYWNVDEYADDGYDDVPIKGVRREKRKIAKTKMGMSGRSVRTLNTIVREKAERLQKEVR